MRELHFGPGFVDGRSHVVGPVGARPLAPRQSPHLLRIAGADFDLDLAAQAADLFPQPRGRDLLFGEFGGGPISCASSHSGPTFSDDGSHRVIPTDPLLDPGKVEADGTIVGFKTPVLRGIRFTAPYFHDGRSGDATGSGALPIDARSAALGVVTFYNTRFNFNFTDAEIAALREFLWSL